MTEQTTEQPPFPPAPRTEVERLAAQVAELQGLLEQAEHAEARALRERDAMRDRVSEPNGCAYCGTPQRFHGRRYVLGVGMHGWERPTDEQVKTRMLARRAARQPLEAVPLVVSRFDTAMEHAPEEKPGLTVGAIAEDGQPVALVFDPESWAKVAGWLMPEAAHLRARIAELKTELARAQQPSYSQRHVWSVWQEEQPAHGFYGTVDDARQGSIDCWEEDEPHCPDYSWKPDGPRLELLVGGEASGVYISRHDVFGALAEPEKELTEARAELARYVGKEPTIAEEMAYLSRCFFAVHAVCDEAEQQARRWENPLPVPDWVATVRAAATGERETTPAALPWAHVMTDDDLHGFLDDLLCAAMNRWRTNPDGSPVPDRDTLAEIEKACAQWRTPGQGNRSDEPGADG